MDPVFSCFVISADTTRALYVVWLNKTLCVHWLDFTACSFNTWSFCNNRDVKATAKPSAAEQQTRLRRGQLGPGRGRGGQPYLKQFNFSSYHGLSENFPQYYDYHSFLCVGFTTLWLCKVTGTPPVGLNVSIISTFWCQHKNIEQQEHSLQYTSNK